MEEKVIMGRTNRKDRKSVMKKRRKAIKTSNSSKQQAGERSLIDTCSTAPRVRGKLVFLMPLLR
jgi:hypothetical protein